ncbi:CDP-alcohol phosphatidyltransferase family protein [Virgibacillus sp. FSP13]
MDFETVKQCAKKDEATSYYTVIKRKTGVLLTWFIIRIFPSVSANAVTLSMFPLNMLVAGILYYAIVFENICVLLISFCISFITLVLDTVDGNIARIKGTSSIKGVYLDRLVHNISHPMFFMVLAFALFASSNQMIYLIMFIIVAILSELSPLDVSQKDVEALFIRQAVLHTTKNYHYATHQFTRKVARKPEKASKIRKIIKTILSNDSYYFVVLLDLLLFDKQFYVTGLFALVDIVGMVYVRSNLNRWESNLHEVLERLSKTDGR